MLNIPKIKFRFWHEDKKILCDVLSITYTKSQIADKITCRFLNDKGLLVEEEFDTIYGELLPSIGATDKNGKELYLGDMVKCSFIKDNKSRFIFFDGGYRIFGHDSNTLFDNLDMAEKTGDMYNDEDIYNEYKKEFNIE